ncbi:MAG: hypothetical protein JWO03_2489 [Bacteroidetes bacterium]|nr:hypothetical protein [Bacteroidota bacterium]
MSTAELKAEIIAKLTEIEDEELLKDALRLITLHNDDLYILDEEELTMVKEAEADIEAGNVLSEEEANKEIQKWLGK